MVKKRYNVFISLLSYCCKVGVGWGLVGGWLGVTWGLPGGSVRSGPRNPQVIPSAVSLISLYTLDR